jgi:two-component system KDP operon response regulator KdpE
MMARGHTSSRVLVVDDETRVRRTVGLNLQAHGFEVDLADTGEAGLDLAARNRPDAVVVDLELPGIGGIEVIEGIRAWSRVPIVVLSVRDTEADKVAALDAGADDYVTKPFAMDEFLARLRAALRQVIPTEDEPVIETGDFRIDLATKRVSRDAQDVRLTTTEWQVLEILARNRGKLVAPRRLLQEVWGAEHQDGTGNLRECIAALRRKLEPDPTRPRYLATEAGLGYRFVASD